MQKGPETLDHSSRQPSLGRIMAVFLLIFAALVLLVSPAAFQIQPASDDFPIIYEVHRGNAQGIGSFFTRSATGQNYRPLKSLAIWIAGNLPGVTPYFWIRVVHLVGLLGLGMVVMLWTRSIRLGLAGSVVAALVIFLHPALPQAWGSIDGVDSLASTAFLWLGAWCAWRFRDRIAIAVGTVLLCFFAGVGFKEYAFALAPLSALVALCFAPPPARRKWAVALVLGGAVSIAIIAIIIIRQWVVPLSDVGTRRGFEYILLTPKQIGQNFAVMATGILFFGNSIWAFVHQDTKVLAIVALVMLAAACVIGVGVLLRLKKSGQTERSSVESVEASPRRWVVFLLLSLVAASFPVWIMFHVSEMYLPQIIVPLSLLAGMAADGYRSSKRPVLQFAAACALAGMLVSSILTIRWKIAGLRDVGDRAAAQIAQILSFLPPDAHDKRIAILFDTTGLPPRRTYAVYRMGDEVLLVHEIVLEWPRFGKNLKLTSRTNEPLVDPQKYDLILRWDAKAQRFDRVAP